MTAPNAAPASTIPEHLIPRQTYLELIDALMQAPEAFDPRSTIIEALGDLANIWPDSIYDGMVTTEAAQVVAA